MIRWQNYNKLSYSAIIVDFNTKKVEKINILRKDLLEEIKKSYKKGLLLSLDDLIQIISSNLKYHYWSRAEYETMIGGLFEENPKNFTKIDIYYQLKDNISFIANMINDELGLNLPKKRKEIKK